MSDELDECVQDIFTSSKPSPRGYGSLHRRRHPQQEEHPMTLDELKAKYAALPAREAMPIVHYHFTALVERYERALEALEASHKIVCHAIMCDMPITKAVADARNKAVAVLATAAKPLTEDAP